VPSVDEPRLRKKQRQRSDDATDVFESIDEARLQPKRRARAGGSTDVFKSIDI